MSNRDGPPDESGQVHDCKFVAHTHSSLTGSRVEKSRAGQTRQSLADAAPADLRESAPGILKERLLLECYRRLREQKKVQLEQALRTGEQVTAGWS